MGHRAPTAARRAKSKKGNTMRKRSSQVVTAILGGGQGTRLQPLTQNRAKPAVPVGGRFRLIDIPISNSLHAGLDRIYLLTQFNTASLHRHIAQTYRFDTFSRGFVNILAAEQTVGNRDWYQGTADAVRQNLSRLTDGDPTEILVLSGDQLYLMDLGYFLRFHREKEADVSIAVKAVSREDARGFGIMRVDTGGRIVEFVEKPETDEELDALTPPPGTFEKMGLHDCDDSMLLASMGIYTFTTPALEAVLAEDESATDFGREIIPRAIEERKVYAFPYDGYWEDIGTIPSFHKANLDLVSPVPPLNLYDPERPIYTHARFLPGTKIQDCHIEQAVLAEGAILEGSQVTRSIIGIRAVLRKNSVLENTIFMGAGEYEPHGKPGEVPIGVGENCVIRNAICDLDVRIGDGVQLINKDGIDEFDGPNYAIRGGIIVVSKGATIESGTII